MTNNEKKDYITALINIYRDEQGKQLEEHFNNIKTNIIKESEVYKAFETFKKVLNKHKQYEVIFKEDKVLDFLVAYLPDNIIAELTGIENEYHNYRNKLFEICDKIYNLAMLTNSYRDLRQLFDEFGVETYDQVPDCEDCDCCEDK